MIASAECHAQEQETPESPVTPEDAEAIREEIAGLDVGSSHNEQERELRRIIAGRARRADQLERVKRESAALIKRLESELRSYDWVTAPAARNLTTLLLAGKKARSVQTPFGKAGFRRSPERMVLANEEALLEAWSAKDVPGVLVSVETRHKFHAAEIDKHYKATGELLPGCELRAAEDAFYIS